MNTLILATRADYIRFVEHTYFGAVRAADHAAVLALFAPGATLTGYMGDAPARIMARHPAPGQEDLGDFMRFAAHFALTYLDFEHTVDLAAQRVASRFTLLMEPHADGPMAHLPSRRMRNCNFFEFAGGVLTNVVAYFANPAGAAA